MRKDTWKGTNMSLRETFDNLDATTSKHGHRDDHAIIHRRLNSVVYADDYASIQAALDDCAARKLRTVLLNASKTYLITQTLNIPAGITLNGDNATIRASAAMDVMIATEQYATVTRCYIHAGGTLATHGVYLSKISERLIDNKFQNFSSPEGAAIKAGGALYTWLERNYVLGAAGYALDALNAYNPVGNYYGMNVFTSIANAWGGRMGVRIEGYGQMRGDAYEGRLDGPCALQIGGNVQSQITVDGVYFEMTLGTAAELVAVRIMGSARATIRDCQMYGQTNKPGMAVQCASAYGITMTSCVFNRWATGLGGMMAVKSPVFVAGNTYINTTTPISLNTSGARVDLMETPA